MIIVVKGDSDPPVCKIVDAASLIKGMEQKKKEIKAKQKETREVHVGVSILRIKCSVYLHSDRVILATMIWR